MADKIQISHLSHKISIDAGDFHNVSSATRGEVAQYRKALRELRDPMERYEKDLKDAEKLLKFGADGQELYNRAIAKAESRLKAATEDTEALRRAEQKRDEDRRRGEAIMERHLTQHNRLQRELKETERLYQSGAIDIRHYRLEVDRLNRELGEQSFLQQAGARFGSVFGLDEIFGSGGGAIAGKVALIGAAITAATTAMQAAQRVADFAIDRFNQDRLAIDNLAKSASAANIEIDKLTGFQFAFGQTSGFADDKTIKLFMELGKRSSEAAAGIGEAGIAFKQLGLDAAQLQQLSPDKQLIEISRAMQTVELRSDRLRIAGKLFGEEQGRAFTTLEKGPENLIAMLERADRLGFGITAEDAAQVEAMNDSIDSLARTFDALSRRLTIEASPAIQELATELQILLEIGLENKDVISLMFDVTVLSEIRAATFAMRFFNGELERYSMAANAIAGLFGQDQIFKDDPIAEAVKANQIMQARSSDPAASIVAGSREAFQAQYRIEVDSQLEVAKEQRDILKEGNGLQREVVAAVNGLADKMVQTL